MSGIARPAVIGVLGIGQMGGGVAADLKASGFDVVSTLDGRSDRTRERAERAGVRVLPALHDVVAACDTFLSIVAAEQAASALQREPRGTLRISAPDSFGWMHVAPATPAFLKRYPELAIDIKSNPAYVNLVDEGLDLAIRIGILEDSALVVRKLAPSRVILCAAPAYLEGRGMPRVPDDLASHNCLCADLPAWGDEWRLVGKRGEVRVPVSGNVRSNNAEMLRAATLDGIGVAALPIWAVAEQLRSGMLRRVLTAWEAPVSTIYAVYPGNRLMSMKVRAFVDHLARCFGRTPYWEDGL